MHMPLETLEPSPPPGCTDWSYFLDVDGTLVDYSDDIEGIHVSARTRLMVHRLAERCDGALALVSGRTVQDLHALFDGEGLNLIGQYGLERRESGGRIWRRSSFTSAMRRRIHVGMAALLELCPLLRLEDKGMMMTLHWRAAPQMQTLALPLLFRLSRDGAAQGMGRLVLRLGQNGVDLMPCAFDKGEAVALMLGKRAFVGRLPVFIGDDWADEPAFIEMNQRGGHSIKVGFGVTHAQYRLKDVAATLQWLHTVAQTPDTQPQGAQNIPAGMQASL